MSESTTVRKAAIRTRTGSIIQFNLGSVPEDILMPDGTTLTEYLSHVESGISESEVIESITNSDHVVVATLPDGAEKEITKRITWISLKEILKSWLDLHFAPIGAAVPAIQVPILLTASGWSGNGPFTQTVSINGLGSTQNGDVGLADTATDAQFEAASAAMIRKTGQATGSMSFKAIGEKPMVDIPAVVTILG